MVFEGQENSAIQQFWALLGGKTAYMDERVLKSLGETTVPRLFHGSNASGSFKSMFCKTLTQGHFMKCSYGVYLCVSWGRVG